ncbi:HYR domain-containing protein [Cystobacter fuscus]|uniref:HYR domain-containing protein n=1 Tax=Cystobacter fuscus TaxID=43 RepID=UPI002B280003|nr:HYR domain-containing protein [Cystobacter fuscus]
MKSRRSTWMALWVVAAGSACGTTESLEPEPVKGVRNLAEHCEVPPPFTGNFEPELQWAWTGGAVLPDHKQVMMTPAVVDVNGDGTPDIVFSSFAGGNYSADGVLRAISGDDGHALWTVTDASARVKPGASITAGDLDGDGQVEICGIPENGRGIICFEHDGTFKFRSAEAAYDYNEWGGPSLADLDGDGSVEILDGNRVYSHTGQLLWVGGDSMGGAHSTGPVSFAVDLDQDGKLEVINGRSVYNFDGSLRCANPNVPHGFAGVANFDADAAGEIVVAGRGKVSLLDDDCSLLWTRDVYVTGHSAAGHGGPPTIADFDGDGQLEIGLPGDWNYTVYGSDGTVKWSSSIQDYSSGRTASTTFDFEDDGRLEVVYADEAYLRIFDGATGEVRWQTRNSSGTTHEYPLVVDVDGDNAAEIIVVSNNHAYPGQNGIRVFHDRKEGWANTRRVWNQHAYSITNVNNGGAIPVHAAPHWLHPKLNVFRANVANYLGEGPSPYAAPDLAASRVTATCDGEGLLVLGASVSNQGEAPVGAGVKVAFYKGSPASGGTLLGVTAVAEPLPVGGSATATLQVASSFSGTAEVWAVVDDDGTGQGSTSECLEDNNGASAPAELSCEVTPVNKPPVALCRDVTVDADASCLGGASVNGGSYDPDNGPSPLAVTEVPSASFGLGTHPVTLTASDGEASDQCVGHVTVVDTTKPAVGCPDSQVLDTCSLAGASASFELSAADNCGSPAVTCSYDSGATFPVGETSVTCSAKDASGNSASCGFKVRVRGDTTPPVLHCPTAPVVVESCAGSAPASFEVSATDNCGPVPVTCSRASGSSFPAGNTSVSCSATDAWGNSASCLFSVQVSGAGSSTPPTPGADRGLELWSPNHKYESLPVSLSECAAPAKDACGGSLPLEQYGRILRITSDEVEDANGNGDGRTCDDMIIDGPTSMRLRSEREGTGDGRVYTVTYVVAAPGGMSTQGTCHVYVPHDQSGRGAVDSGVKFCVGEGCPPGTAEHSPLCK